MTDNRAPSADDKLQAYRDGAVGHIVFNNQARHNAVSLEMWQQLQALLADYACDASLRVSQKVRMQADRTRHF